MCNGMKHNGANTAGQFQHGCRHLLSALVVLTSCYDAHAAVRRMTVVQTWQGSRKVIDVQSSLDTPTPPPNVSVPPEIQQTLDDQQSQIDSESTLNPQELQGNLQGQQEDIAEEVYRRLDITPPPAVSGASGASGTTATNATNGTSATSGTDATDTTAATAAPRGGTADNTAPSTQEVQDALTELEQMQFTVRSLQDHMGKIRNRLAKVTNDITHVMFRIVAVRENSARLQKMAVIRSHIFERLQENVSEQVWNITAMQSPMESAEDELDRINSTIVDLRSVSEDVTNAGQQKLEELNNRIWDVSEPDSPNYIGNTERQVDDLVGSEHNLTATIYGDIRNIFDRNISYITNATKLRDVLDDLRSSPAGGTGMQVTAGANESSKYLGRMLGLGDGDMLGLSD